MSNEKLRGCPTCATPVSEAHLGLRDYRWVADALPGRVAPMDIDFMLERHGKVLILEFKPWNVKPGTGQAMTFRSLERLGIEVWVVEGEGPEVAVTRRQPALLDDDPEEREHAPYVRTIMTLEDLVQETRAWFDAA